MIRRPPSSTLFPNTPLSRSLLSVSNPPRMLMSVVFPDPEGPIRATHSPPFTAKLTPLSARKEPYCLIRLSMRSEEHTSELQSRLHLVCRLLLEKKNK